MKQVNQTEAQAVKFIGDTLKRQKEYAEVYQRMNMASDVVLFIGVDPSGNLSNDPKHETLVFVDSESTQAGVLEQLKSKVELNCKQIEVLNIRIDKTECTDPYTAYLPKPVTFYVRAYDVKITTPEAEFTFNGNGEECFDFIFNLMQDQIIGQVSEGRLTDIKSFLKLDPVTNKIDLTKILETEHA